MEAATQQDSDWTIVIADDHPLVRQALKQAVSSIGTVVIREAASLAETFAAVESGGAVDLVLLDLDMPGMEGFTGLATLRARHPTLPVAIVSATADRAVIGRAQEFGAAGFIPKSSDLPTIAEAVEQILDGQIWLPEDELAPAAGPSRAAADELTPQQLNVLSLMSRGMLNKQIAFEIGIGEATVKAHVTAILKKLGVHSRTQAVIAARLLDLVPRT